MQDDVLSVSTQSLAGSVVLIVFIIIFVILFFIFSILAAIIISRTIIGPWRRLNVLQEQTINKFVPKSFLKLLGVNRVMDVRLSMHTSKDMAVMVVNIKRFTKMTNGMSERQVFQMVNDYLSYIGPVLRSYRGYIDKYASLLIR